jgi:transcriptional regulator with XRE-family HTH domain
MTLSDCLKKVRHERKESQLYAAEKIGICFQQLSAYESGKHEPRASILIAMADHYNVSLDYLTGRTEKR